MLENQSTDNSMIHGTASLKQRKVDLGFNYHVYIDGIYAGVKTARTINSTVYDPMLSIAVQKITYGQTNEPIQHIL